MPTKLWQVTPGSSFERIPSPCMNNEATLTQPDRVRGPLNNRFQVYVKILWQRTQTHLNFGESPIRMGVGT